MPYTDGMFDEEMYLRARGLPPGSLGLHPYFGGAPGMDPVDLYNRLRLHGKSINFIE